MPGHILNSRIARFWLFGVMLAFTCLAAGAGPVHAEPTAPIPITVTNTNDSGPGSLRQAITDANSYSLASIKAISFQIPTTDPGFDGKVFMFKPLSVYPIVLSGVIIDGSTQTMFTGDTNPDGPEVLLSGSQAGGASGIHVSGDDVQISDLIVNGFDGNGILVSYERDGTSSRNRILRNYVGTDASGSKAVPNVHGIEIHGYGSPTSQAQDNVVSDNLVSGNGHLGITICDAANTTVQNNRVGVTRSGTQALGNGNSGIEITCAGAVRSKITDNVIAYNGDDGIQVAPDYRYTLDGHQAHAFRRNAVFSNTDLGINLLAPPFGSNDGVTPNDVGDADVGGNLLQNYPVLTAALAGATLNVKGTLNSTPNSTFDVEFFLNDAVDPSGHGEGQQYIGVATVTTDGSGNASFDTVLSVVATGSQYVTATATDAAGNTSEFSNAVQVVEPVAKARITIVKDVQPDSVTNFQFSGGLGSFALDDPTMDDSDAYTKSKTFAVTAGAYKITENAYTAYYLKSIVCTPAGKAVVALGTRSVTVTAAAGDEIRCVFTNQRKGTIVAAKFNDLNANGYRGTSEPWLNGWTMMLFKSPSKLIAQGVTAKMVDGGVAVDGRYIFKNVTPGLYTLCEVQQTGWRSTRPLGTNPSYGNRPCIALQVGVGQLVRVLFGNTTKPGALNGSAALDALADVDEPLGIEALGSTDDEGNAPEAEREGVDVAWEGTDEEPVAGDGSGAIGDVAPDNGPTGNAVLQTDVWQSKYIFFLPAVSK